MGNTINYTFIAFDLEGYIPSCTYDYVAVSYSWGKCQNVNLYNIRLLTIVFAYLQKLVYGVTLDYILYACIFFV